jgi:cell division transport system permease protein
MNRIFFILRSSFAHVIQNPLLNILSILSLALAYLIFNTSLLVYSNLQGAVKRWEKSFVIIAYVKKNVPEETTKKIFDSLKQNGKIKDIKFVSSDEALKNFREQLGNNSFLLDGLEDNPLPAYFIITPYMDNKGEVERIIEELRTTENIEEIQYEKDVVLKFIRALSTLKVLSGVLNLFVLITVVFIVSNTIRLSFFARKDEIEIMKLVGASDVFVGAPYVIESLWQNLVSIILSLIFLYFLYTMFLQPLSDSLSFLFGIKGFSFLQTRDIAFVIFLALFIGITGSFISLRRYMKV